MKNAGMAGAVALVGIGLLSIGLSNFANRAQAVPSAVAAAGPDEPVIVWYEDAGRTDWPTNGDRLLLRAWSDGTIEGRAFFLNSSEFCSAIAR